MMNRSAIGVAISLAAVIASSSGCGSGGSQRSAAAEFDSIAGETAELYLRLHPLRSSRLGLEGADSLLFTFSKAEVDEALENIGSLLGAISAIPTAGLDQERLDDSILLVDWLKGERYALYPGGTAYDNPALI